MNDFEHILEYVPISYKLQINICSFIDKLLPKLTDCKKIIVSLSGGVDSMVLVSVLKFFSFDVVAVHINYNNRNETCEEQRFLQYWCNINQIPFHVKEITHIKRSSCLKRSVYEEETTTIRFDFYRYILDKEQCEYILLGHHKDDIVENIFSNVCQGRNILDLKVITQCNIVNNVNIMRPLIDFTKSEIYEFANKNNIPYFLDTTPKWSVRGKYRNTIAKELSNTFGKQVCNNIFEIGEQSTAWSFVIMNSIVNPFLNRIEYSSDKLTMWIDGYESYPFCFWNTIFIKIFHKQNLKCPSRKSIYNFINFINAKVKNRNFNLNKNSKCVLFKKQLHINFTYAF